MPVIQCTAVVAASIAVCMDIYREKVSNGFICIICWVGLGLRQMGISETGVIQGILGCIVPLVLLFPLFLGRMLGAGDIKLLASLGMLMGFPAILFCLGWALIFGAALSFAILIFCGDFLCRLQYFLFYVRKFLQTGKADAYRKEGKQVENFHFTVPIFMAVLLYTGGFY